jgi:3-oxoadipate enol-lactonase
VTLAPGGRWLLIEPGVRLWCEIGGTARATTPPLLLLPSIAGGSTLWGSFRQQLELDFTVVALDPRGFGASSPEPLWPSTRRMARDVALALDALGLHQVDVFAISFGGLLATFLAIDHPQRIRRLVLGSAAARGLDFSPKSLAKAARLAASTLAESPNPELSEEILADDAPPITRARARARAARRPWSRATLLRFLAAVIGHAPRAELYTLHTDVLLLWGERDPVVGPAARQRLARRLSHAESQLLADAGHDFVLEAPQRAAALVAEFLRRPQ